MLSGLVGFVGLMSLGTGGFLTWRSWRTHRSIMVSRSKDPAMDLTGSNHELNDSSVLSVDWSPDGKRILVGQMNGSAQSWDALTGKHTHTYQSSRATAGAWSPDGRHIALADLISAYNPTPTVINPLSGAIEAEAPFSRQIGNVFVQALAWSPDSQSIAVAGPASEIVPEKLSIRLWHPSTGEVSQSYTLAAYSEVVRVGTIAWSSDGQYLATNYFGFSSNGLISELADTSGVFIWYAQSGALLFRYETVQYPLMDGPEGYGGKFLSWSPDNQHLALANHTTVQILELTSQNVHLTYTGHVSQVQALAYSPDGKYIASGAFDWTVQVWEAATGALQFLYQGHTAIVHDVSWSPDGKYIVSCGDDGTAQVWQPEL